MNDEIRKELRDIAPRLSGKDRREPFQPPVDYFEGLPSKVQERISKARPADAVPILDWLTRYRWAPVLTSVLVAVIFSIVLFLTRGGDTSGVTAEVRETAKTAAPAPGAVAEVTAEDLVDELSYSDMEDLLAEAEAPVAGVEPTRKKAAAKKPEAKKESAELEEYILDNFDEYTLTEIL